MADLWLYQSNRRKLEPLSQAQLKEMISSGQIRPGDMVFQQGTQKWVPASSIADVSTVHDLDAQIREWLTAYAASVPGHGINGFGNRVTVIAVSMGEVYQLHLE